MKKARTRWPAQTKPSRMVHPATGRAPRRTWCLPDGRSLADFALSGGFLSPSLFGDAKPAPDRRGEKVEAET